MSRPLSRYKRISYAKLPYAAEFSFGGEQRYIKLHTGHMKVSGDVVLQASRANTPVKHYLTDDPSAEVLRSRAERVGGVVEDARQTAQSDQLVAFTRKKRAERVPDRNAGSEPRSVAIGEPFVFVPPKRKGGA